jgi:SagB-type dehydrogenase family enzyme
MKFLTTVLLASNALLLFAAAFSQEGPEAMVQVATQIVQLPAPRLESPYSLEKALATRRSVREFKNEPLSIAALSQLVWAAQGITQKMDAPENWSWGTWQGGKRTAPSAGALYPLEVYVLVGNIDGIKPGVYKYKPQTHQLLSIDPQDRRKGLAAAALGQNWIQTAPCVFVVTAVYKRTEVKYGDRATRYVHIEVGHAVENICLQAVALDLGCTMVGAFKDDEVKKVVGMADDEEPLAIVPVGKGAK